MIQFFTGAWAWLTDPKNKTVLRLVFIVALVLIILMQCSRNRGLKQDLEAQKTETQRIVNNYEATKAPLIQTKINDSTLLAERQILKLTMEELKKNYSDLMVGFEKFKKQNPKVIEKIYFNNKETIKDVSVVSKLDSLGNGSFTFSDSAKFADGNSRTLTGNLPYKATFINKKDSTSVDLNKLGIMPKITPGPSSFSLEQNMKLKVGLFEDPKTKKVSIGVTTSYPGITFTKLEGADVMSDETSRKATRNFRKTWGIGFTLGYGGTVDFKSMKLVAGPQVGVGITYTPKFLQWGK